MFELNDIHGRVLFQSRTAKSWQATLVEAVRLHMDLSAINLDNRDLAELNLAGMNAPGASCRGAHLRRCNLQRVIMPKSDFTGANLGEAEASEANFSGSDFSHVQAAAINMPRACLDGIHGKGLQASNAVLDYCSFRNAHLPAVNLSEASALSTDWTGATLLGGNLNNVLAMRSTLNNVIGESAKFANADLRWCSMSGNFASADFYGANLTAVMVVGKLNLTGARFEAANGVGPNTHSEAVQVYLQERTQTTKHHPVAETRMTASY